MAYLGQRLIRDRPRYQVEVEIAYRLRQANVFEVDELAFLTWLVLKPLPSLKFTPFSSERYQFTNRAPTTFRPISPVC